MRNLSCFYPKLFLLSVALKHIMINIQINTQFICVPHIMVIGDIDMKENTAINHEPILTDNKQ